MLGVVKMALKGKVGGHALNSHGNYILEHGKSCKNHGIVFLNFLGNPVQNGQVLLKLSQTFSKRKQHHVDI